MDTIWFSPVQDSKGKCPLLSVVGPQNGWNDPPALNRVPKKKKVLEKVICPVAYRCSVNHIATWSTPHFTDPFKGKAYCLIHLKCISAFTFELMKERKESRKQYSAMNKPL